MLTSFDVASSTGSYRVEIGPGAFDAMLHNDGDRLFIVDAFLEGRVRVAGIDPVVIVADERAKSLDRMAELVVQLGDRGATRGTHLVAVGGGVVQDAAAFVASIYMRGIDWSYMPSTLLSMVDSCIGGKSSINVGAYKNFVGTFHPPAQVLIDPELIGSLSPEQRTAGLIEAAKICLCRGADYFDEYLTLGPAVGAADQRLGSIIGFSLRAKSWFIEIDEFDRAERQLLNFGHTFGHAIETASNFGVSHGIAVGLGMEAAFAFGELLGRDYRKTAALGRFRDHIAGLLASVNDLPARLEGVTIDALVSAFRSDKKHRRDAFAMIIPRADGGIERMFVPRDSETETNVAAAFAAAAAITKNGSGAAIADPVVIPAPVA